MKTKIKFSILMNCYNGAKYLEEAIKSVLVQTYTNWEIIFWDNLSTDNSFDIVKDIAKKHPKIQLYKSHKHTLLYEARNLALQKCRGDIICFLDIDDFWTEDKLQKQVDVFSDPEVGLVYGNFWFLNQRNGKCKIASKNHLPSGNILNNLLNSYSVGLLTIAVRKSIIDKKKIAFNNEYNFIGDFDFVINISKNYKIKAIQECIGTCRKHFESMTSTNRQLQCKELSHWLKTAKKDPILSKNKNLIKIKNNINYCFAISAIIQGQKKDAFKYIVKLRLGFYIWKPILALLLPQAVVIFLINLI